jgi:hypothetical protein
MLFLLVILFDGTFLVNYLSENNLPKEIKLDKILIGINNF